MSHFKYLLCGIFVLSLVYRSLAADCLINISILNEKHPLFLTLNTYDIIYPEAKSNTLLFKTNEDFVLDCPGTGKIQAGDIVFDRTATATCISDGHIRVGDHKINVAEIICTKKITSVARFTSNICWKRYREIEVGFLLPGEKFVQIYTTCFDDHSKNIVYSTLKMTRHIGHQTTGNTRPAWTEGKFYNLTIKLDKLYNNEVHRQTINRQIGLSDDDTTYVKPTGNYYLAKGHLTPRVDFIFNAEQLATFHYINSVPQWQTFNGRNWFYLERNLRNLASKNYIELTIYTGTYGISTLPHQITGKDTELYLYQDINNGKRALPIPEIFWKVAYDEENKAGVAVLGVNNPYQIDVSKSIICKDVSDQISWLNFEISRIESGYLYACSIPDFRKVIKDFPNLKVTKLLK